MGAGMKEESIWEGRGKVGRCEPGAKNDKALINTSMGEKEAEWFIGPAV
jgi:hypothetical protein